ALLNQERLIYFLNGSFIFPNGRRNRLQTHRSSFKFVDNGGQNPVIHFVQSVFIYVQGIQRIARNGRIDLTGTFYLRKVARSPKQRVGYTRRSAASSCNFISSLFVDLRIQNL